MKGYHRKRIFASGERVIMVDFKELYAVNVNDNVEKKNGLTYLSWAWAWAEFLKRYPQAEYEIVKFDGLPYVYDANTGYMVYTRVTVDDLTREMWLPVMDGANKAMLALPYKYVDRYGKEKTVAPATMFDINKTIMRCLVKNLAMFGLGLYIYAGEDLPEEEQSTPKTLPPKGPVMPKKASEDSVKYILANATDNELKKVVEAYKINQLSELSEDQAQKTIRAINKRKVESGNAI